VTDPSGGENGGVPGGNSTADNVLKVLSLFTNRQLALTANEIAEQMGMSRSRCYRYIASLQTHGLIESTKNGQFRLGQRIFELARIARRAIGTTDSVLPVMEKLALETEASVLVTRRWRDRIVVLEFVAGPYGASLLYSRGDNLPFHASASAKVLLAYMDRSAAEMMLAETTWTRFTEHTPPDAATVLRDVDLVREQGYAITNGETVVGIRGIAAPIFDRDGQVQLALSVGLLAFRVSEEQMPFLIEQVTAAAGEISQRIQMLED
jgi:DNA-binding IclR family transcriptional regulator